MSTNVFLEVASYSFSWYSFDAKNYIVPFSVWNFENIVLEDSINTFSCCDIYQQEIHISHRNNHSQGMAECLMLKSYIYKYCHLENKSIETITADLPIQLIHHFSVLLHSYIQIKCQLVIVQMHLLVVISCLEMK